MEDLKTLVIQSLENEGTLSSLRTQLRARVYKAIEKQMEPGSKSSSSNQQQQMQNVPAQKVHESEEGKLLAQLVREYLEFYRMEYSLSVYLPEVALSNQENPQREDLCKKASLKPPQAQESSAPLLVHLIRQLRQIQSQPLEQNDNKEPIQILQKDQKLTNNKIEFPGQNQNKRNDFYDEIDEDILEEVDDKHHQNIFHNRDEYEGVGASSSLGIDQSIDTLRMDEYDYVEQIKYYKD
ncbi:fgfr1 oncogene partner [Stylonychia lemnae]|uniref:Fgfr1 oncogene partner n=1 Tax=Stylonychia lemnae TaxID=5949 RepID=A0A078BCZ3_STYLE|nr:fgfr1 oncogene partner [Stylonychia lemnae]|eukprot:CDW91463.1 fgfr1 oncogene partner [Stylonychia lemnae]